MPMPATAEHAPVGGEVGGYPVFDPQLCHRFGHLQLQRSDRRLFALGRHAITALCRSVRPRRVWLPRFMCHSVKQAFENEGVVLMPYALNERLLPQQTDPDEQDVVLLFNYFGLQAHRSDFLAQVDAWRGLHLLVDNTHSFGLDNQFPGVFSCVSPRKFLPVTDGGIAYDPAGWLSKAHMPSATDASWQRMGWLFRAWEDGGRGPSYADYAQARDQLRQTPYSGMSPATAFWLDLIDVQTWLALRQGHYQTLAAQVPCHPLFSDFRHGSDFSPIGYPVHVPHAGQAQAALARHKVFAVRYWPELETSPALNAMEKELLQHLLFIPLSAPLSPPQVEALRTAVSGTV